MTEKTTKEKDAPFEATFTVPRFKGGKPIYNDKKELVTDTYRYCFSEMGMDRKLTAKKFFELAGKMAANPPKTPDHVEILSQRQLEIKAFSAILMKQNDDGDGYELYDPAKTELSPYVMNELGKTEEDWDKLLAVQDDFFSKARLVSGELMRQSRTIMMQFLAIMKEAESLAGNFGIHQEGQMMDFLTKILDAAKSSPTTSTDSESTPTDFITKSLESLSPGASSDLSESESD